VDADVRRMLLGYATEPAQGKRIPFPVGWSCSRIMQCDCIGRYPPSSLSLYRIEHELGQLCSDWCDDTWWRRCCVFKVGVANKDSLLTNPRKHGLQQRGSNTAESGRIHSRLLSTVPILVQCKSLTTGALQARPMVKEAISA
jgi:hypothetical protein